MSVRVLGAPEGSRHKVGFHNVYGRYVMGRVDVANLMFAERALLPGTRAYGSFAENSSSLLRAFCWRAPYVNAT